ncbi:hypothetical protein RM190_00545 [Paracoccus sp. CPCC 101403]|uniref:Uncharacterized protein n=1 Tax=Paracoccus broussonetiae TaxID=3075834 RepID=A0ABU3E841_9RHOB|nr:hypothetical protein [Paracoccus sp. CPCC 101403]MDT1060321.1 hypothetical protein [Paracoccus sp. CPCC 101403]
MPRPETATPFELAAAAARARDAAAAARVTQGIAARLADSFPTAEARELATDATRLMLCLHDLADRLAREANR